MKNAPLKKWVTVKILRSIKKEVDSFCKVEKHGFTNSTQFINFTVRQELDKRKGEKL